MQRYALGLVAALLACSPPSKIETVNQCGPVEIPGDGIDNDCDGYSAPLLVYAVGRYSGEVYAVNAESGELAWVKQIDDGAGGPAPLIDVVRGPDGRLFVSALDSGVEVLSADGSSRESLVTGKSHVHGLFFDRLAGKLLVTTGAGDIFEVDPSNGAETAIVTAVAGEPVHSVRLAGDDAIYSTFRQAPSRLRRYDPVSATWTDIAFFPVPVNTIAIAQDGSLLVNAACANWACAGAPYDFGCVFRPSRSAIPADADHPFRQGDHPGRDAAG